MDASINRMQKLPLVSIVLVAVNIIVYIICGFTGELLYEGGSLNLYDVFLQGEWGRLIWSMFLHSSHQHIFNNMLILFCLGAMLEQEMSHLQFGICYFLSGIGAGLTSLFVKAFSQEWAGSIGASGAVFGLDGVLVALFLFSGRKMPTVTPVRILLMLIFSLYSGFLQENVDNAAHVGGLITGFLTASVMCMIDRKLSHKKGDISW